jgi:putative flippase GtrA
MSANFVKQVQRFAVSGLLATGLHALVAIGLIESFAISAPLANGIAFLVATIFSYAVNTLWSFSSVLYGRNLFRFICVSMIGGGLAVSVSALAAHFKLHYLVGIGIVAVTVPPVTFLLHRFWTYR